MMRAARMKRGSLVQGVTLSTGPYRSSLTRRRVVSTDSSRVRFVAVAASAVQAVVGQLRSVDDLGTGLFGKALGEFSSALMPPSPIVFRDS